MSHRKDYLLLLLGVFLSYTLAVGQAARSPFSNFGIGEQFGSALATHQGMGGVGFSNPQYWYINNQNPALLVYNRLTTFEAGMVGEQRTQATVSSSEKSGSGNLNYLALSVGIKPGWWSSSFALMPYTRLNYQLKHTDEVEGAPGTIVEVFEEGSGGFNQFSWSNGVSLNSYLSVGLKASYIFSSILNEYSTLLNVSGVPLSPKVVDRTSVSDFIFTPGVSFHFDSVGRRNFNVNVGVVYDIGTDLNVKFHESLQRHNAQGLLDSTTLVSNAPGKITVPGNLMLGFSVSPRQQNWIAAIDAAYADYSVYKGFDGSNPHTGENWKIAGGFEYTPDRTSLSNYLKRMTYRTGVSLENYPYLVNGEPVRDFGITFGLSMPVNRISSLDFAIKFGTKGDKVKNTIEENYLKLYFGITFNDQWFIKRRFD